MSVSLILNSFYVVSGEITGMGQVRRRVGFFSAFVSVPTEVSYDLSVRSLSAKRLWRINDIFLGIGIGAELLDVTATGQTKYWNQSGSKRFSVPLPKAITYLGYKLNPKVSFTASAEHFEFSTNAAEASKTYFEANLFYRGLRARRGFIRFKSDRMRFSSDEIDKNLSFDLSGDILLAGYSAKF